MKSAKNLLVPLVIMILLAIGVVVFFVVDRSLKKRPAETSYNQVDLLYISPVDIASVSVLHRDGNVNVKVDRSQAADGTVVYGYSGSDKSSENYSQTKMEEFMITMNSFVACEAIAENANLSDYGLDNPVLTVTITKTDGTQKSILMGNLSPDGSKCYVCAAGSSSVYMSKKEKLEIGSRTGNYFLDDRIIDMNFKDIESVKFNRVKDSIELFGTSVYNETTNTVSFRFSQPFEIGSSNYFDKLIENICGLSAADHEDATNENLSKFGVAVPSFRFTLNFKGGKTYTVALSSAKGGFYYGRINGTGKIFKVEAQRLEIIESPVLVLLSDYVFNNSCDELDSVEVSGNKGKFVMKFDVPKDKLITDKESTVTLDGRNARVVNGSGRSYAAMLYESIFCIKIDGVEENAMIPENAVADTTIKVYDRNHSTVVYEFFRRNTETFYVTKNGEYTGFYVLGIELYNDGGTDTYNYGIWPAYEILTKAITNGINGVYEIPDGK